MRGILFKYLCIVPLLGALAGCLAKSSADEDYHPGIGVPRLTVTTSQETFFSSTYLGGSSDVIMTLTNRGGGTVTRLAAVALSSPLSYTGGTFPGTGGDCGTTLDAGASCTFVLTYAPTSATGVDLSLTLTYYNGAGVNQKTMTETVALDPLSATSGTLDTQTTASTVGYWYQAFGSGHDTAYATAIDCSGKVLVGGAIYNGSDYDLAVARFNTDGTLDTTWGSSGYVQVDISSNDYVDSMAVGSDCLIYAGGGRNASALDMISLNADGTFNTAFSTDGKATIDYNVTAGITTVYTEHMLIQPDGKIVVAGWAMRGGQMVHFIARITTAGARDSAFGTSGRVVLDYYQSGYGLTNNFINGIALTSTGDIVWAGESLHVTMTPTYHGMLGRASSTGAVEMDLTGYLDPELSGISSLYGIALDDDENYIVNQSGLLKFSSSGVQDTSFTNGGAAGVSNYRMLRLSNGKYLRMSSGYLLARYNSDGSVDTTFGTSGLATGSVGASGTSYALAVQNDGKYVLVGTRSNGSNWDFGISRLWP